MYDGAEIFKLDGIFLLYELSKQYEKKGIELYRDDRLTVFKSKRGLELGKIKKSF